jgi:Kef-type K+ transport system membrane component KefB
MESVRFLLDLSILLFAAKVFGLIAKRFGVPEVVGQIVAGLLLGPAVFHVVEETDFLAQMAEIGVMMIMFEAGLGTDLNQMRKTGIKAVVIAFVGVAVPIIMGALLYMLFYGFGAPGSDAFIRAVFIGTIISATSVSITVAALKELGKLNGEVGTAITGAAIIDDVIGIVVLTLVLGMKGGSGSGSGTGVGMVLLKVVLFFALTIGTGFIIHKLMKWLDEHYPHTRRIPIASLCYCFLVGYIAETYFGIADITGAYMAGVVLCNLSDRDYIESKIDISSYMVFAPLFFTGIGLKTSFASMDMKLLAFSIIFVVIALVSKVFGCGGSALLLGFSKNDALKIGIGMMSRGEVALITAQKGLAAGIIASDCFTAVILLIVVSSIVTPICLKKAYQRA